MYKSQTSYLPIIGYLGGICIIYFLMIKQGILPAIFFAGIPALCLFSLGIFRKIYYFYFFFVVNYVVMGLTRYIPLKGGVVMLVLTLLLLLTILINSIHHRQEWSRSKTYMVFICFIWFTYSFFEIFNPNCLVEPWYISINNLALYPLICAIIVPIIFTKHKHFEWLLILWAFLTLFAAAKGYWQRNKGFDPMELDWLYNKGGGSTHLIRTGIRYFSIYTDAANFGAGMGLAMTIFGISGFYIKKYSLKILFWITSFAGGYGLIISGTRSDFVIPIVGLIVYIILCRNVKAIFVTGFILLSTYFFLNHSTIGDDNRLIHRMRTTFDIQDASWQARVTNREKLKVLMKDKPFGIGLGLGGVKAKRFIPYHPLAQIPTDSVFVMTWVETGIVGLILYIFMLLSLLAHGSFITMFQIKNKELQGILMAIIAGISGIVVTCYANEVFTYPNGIIVYTLLAFLYTAKYYDKELQNVHSS